MSEGAAHFGSIAAEARSMRSPIDFANLSRKEVEFFFVVRADAVRRDHKAQPSADGSSSFSEVNRASTPIFRILLRLASIQTVVKFHKGNVNAFRRSGERASGVRSVVLLPMRAVLYLTGIHRLKPTTLDRSNAGRMK
jgi:hypothetical protein